MEQTELNSLECWLPGASIWVTTLDNRNTWLKTLDYKLNFQISHLKTRTSKAQQNLNQDSDLLLIAPHGMLPTDLVVLIKSWDNIDKLKSIVFPYQSTIVRLFNPNPELELTEDLKARFQFELVYSHV